MFVSQNTGKFAAGRRQQAPEARGIHRAGDNREQNGIRGGRQQAGEQPSRARIPALHAVAKPAARSLHDKTVPHASFLHCSALLAVLLRSSSRICLYLSGRRRDESCLSSRGSFKCLGITSDEEESLSILIAKAGPAQAQLLTWDRSNGSLVVHQ